MNLKGEKCEQGFQKFICEINSRMNMPEERTGKLAEISGEI